MSMAFNKTQTVFTGLLLVLGGSLSFHGQSHAVSTPETVALLAGPIGGHGGLTNGNKAPSQGYLGIMIRDVSDSDLATLHLKSTRGAQVTMVDHDGPACKAGLRERDVILSLNGVTVDGEDQIRRMLHELPPGHPVSLVIERSGAEQTVNAVMANREELEKKAWEQHWVVPEPVNDSPAPVSEPVPSIHGAFGRTFMNPGTLLPLPSAYTGAKVDTMGAQLADYFGVKDGKGLLVHDVDTNSPAAQAGLRAGDVVTRINTIPVATKSAWMHAMRESKGHLVSLTVMRDRHEQTLTMLVDPKHRSAVETPLPSTSAGWTPMLLQ